MEKVKIFLSVQNPAKKSLSKTVWLLVPEIPKSISLSAATAMELVVVHATP